MNSICFTFFLFFFSLSAALAQDLITTRQGEEIEVSIVEVTASVIKYVQAGAAFSKPTSEIFMIRFANGTKQVFTPEKAIAKFNPTPEQVKQIYDDSLFIRGRKEAAKYYKGNRGLNTVTIISTTLIPPLGLVAAIGTTAIPPSRRQLRFPDVTLYNIPAYAKGYRRKANSIKAGQVWTNFGIGCAFFGIAYFSISRYR